MQTQNSAISMARLSIGRPSAAIEVLKTQDKDTQISTIRSLRVFPAALIALLRADNAPKALKIEVENELELAGFKMMT